MERKAIRARVVGRSSLVEDEAVSAGGEDEVEFVLHRVAGLRSNITLSSRMTLSHDPKSAAYLCPARGGSP